MAKESAKEAKEKYRVKIKWVGGPEIGETIEGKINPVLLPNVVRVRDNEKAGSGDADAQKIRSQADEYAVAKRKEANDILDDALKVLDKAKADSEVTASESKAEADKIIADAKAEADKLLEEATKPSAKK